MSFENEKDILNSSDNISDDDAISWDSIIDTDEDGIVSIKKPSSDDIPTEVFTNDTGDSGDTEAVNIDDIVVGNSDSSPSSNDETINEDELKLILGGDTSDGIEYIDDSQEVDADALNEILMGNTDTNTEVSEEEAPALDDENNDEIIPRKEEIKNKSSISPVLLALLFALLVSAGIYFAYTFFLNKAEEDAMSQQNMPQQDIGQPSENISAQAGESVDEEAQNTDIPVVNEDEASNLKPEEKAEEKKEVISVVPTGRVNPFAPLQKYVYVPPAPAPVPTNVVVKTINNIDMSSVQIPKPPKAYGDMKEIAEKLMSVSVSGIMYDAQKPSAIINFEDNDYFVQIGDKLNNFKVIDIGPSNVKIALGKNVYKAEVGERFKIQSEFFGNSYSDGIRQYYSSEDEFNNRAQNTKKYTSSDDVKIYTK